MFLYPGKSYSRLILFQNLFKNFGSSAKNFVYLKVICNNLNDLFSNEIKLFLFISIVNLIDKAIKTWIQAAAWSNEILKKMSPPGNGFSK